MVGFCVYILSNEYNSVYVGQSHNLVARLKCHNQGMVVSSRSGRPWKLVCVVMLDSREDALAVESVCRRLYCGKWGAEALAVRVKSDSCALKSGLHWVWTSS